MSLVDKRDGHYDKCGQWYRDKLCFISCGERCTCTPPNNEWYNAEYDERDPWELPNEYGEMPGGICCQRSVGKFCYDHDKNNYVKE